MTERNNRLREAIDGRSSQQKLADKLKITRQAVNLRLASEKDIDSIEFIAGVADLTGYSFEWLCYGEEKANVEEPMVGYWKDKTLKAKDDLIAELRGKVEDLKKIVEKQDADLQRLKQKQG